MAAERVELDFGDRELFEEFEDSKPSHIRFNDSEDAGEAETMRKQLLEFEERVGCLKAENQELKRKLNLLTQPSKIVVSDSKTDGPMVQILFMNNNISKQFHQEIEDFITGLVEKYERELQSDSEKTSFNMKPQPSSVLLEEHLNVKTSSTVKKIKEAFHVVGSVQYFTNFCLDKLGQPLLNENPQLTDGWEIPKYQQVFAQVVSLDGQEVELKAKRPKPCCFNCGSTEHQLKDCPKPRDLARISEKRKEFMTMASDSPHSGSQQRYHAERFEKFKPGVISVELKEALGMTDETLPPFIYRMRRLGYPPGWLLETQQENSGLALYDGKDPSDSETEHDSQHLETYSPSYDTSKLIDYAGFNAVIPKGIQDEWRQYGSIPMQSYHLKEYFAHQLAADYPTPKYSTNKRSSDADSSLRSVKKLKSEEIDLNMNSFDMDMDSAINTPDNYMEIESNDKVGTVDNNMRSPSAEASSVDSRDEPINSVGHASYKEESTPPENSKMEIEGSRIAQDSTPTPEAPIGGNRVCLEETEASVTSAAVSEANQENRICSVPDVSKFATGITPFEYDNLSEATGTYLKLRSLLKNSPRNRMKNK
ncbi:zinc finger CCHC domain-containing protein 8 isoform X4 [Mustelus asterias]